MIKNFKNDLTKTIFNDKAKKGFPSALIKIIRRKLMYLDAAISLQDLRVPIGNRLEALKGDRHGQHSIRVNDRYRICFVWTLEGPTDVEFIDYH